MNQACDVSSISYTNRVRIRSRAVNVAGFFLAFGICSGYPAELCLTETPPSAHSSSIDFQMLHRSPTGRRSQWRRASEHSMRFFPDMACPAAD